MHVPIRPLARASERSELIGENGMSKTRILHLEDSPADAFLLRESLAEQGFATEIVVATSSAQFLAGIEHGQPDVILLDNGVPGFSGRHALAMARTRLPEVPVIMVSGSTQDEQIAASLQAGAAGFVPKGHWRQLGVMLQRLTSGDERTRAASQPVNALRPLLAATQELTSAPDLAAISAIVMRATRAVTSATGSALLMREGEEVVVSDAEPAAGWDIGRRFPRSANVDGGAMRQQSFIVFEDAAGTPAGPEWIRSACVVPVGGAEPMAAIVAAWDQPHRATPEEISGLEALAAATAAALARCRTIARLEQSVRDQANQLAAAQQELDALMFSVSHDVRTPLRSIGSLVHLMAKRGRGKLADDVTSFLGRIQSEIECMAEMIEELMRLARLGRADLQCAEVDLGKLAAEQVENLRAADPARRVEVTIAPRLQVRGDSRLLRVVVEELLTNAWKFTAHREPAMIRLGVNEAGGGDPVFFVRDNGAGFDLQYATRLFTPFQRMHRQEEYPGLGIGLAKAARIIQRHGGRLWVEASEDQGATFFFTVPGASRH